LNSPEVRIAARQPSLHFLYGGELGVVSCQLSVVVNDLRDFRDLNDPSTAASTAAFAPGCLPAAPTATRSIHPLTTDNCQLKSDNS